MVRLHAFLVVRDGMSALEFHVHWRDVHGPLAARIRRARAYVQSHRLPWQPLDLPVLSNGGCAQVWFDDAASADGLMADPDYTENAARDEDNFHHMDRMTVLRTTDYVALDGDPMARDPGAVKVIQLVRRAPGVTPAEFRRRWLSPAAGDRAAVELGALRHERGASIDADGRAAAEQGFDGIRELWWPDVWCFIAARSRAAAWDRLTGGPLVDAAGNGFLVTTEHRVVWPPVG